MRKRSFSRLLFAVALAIVPAATAEEIAFRVHPRAGELLKSYCLSCHDADTQKGDIRLDKLDSIPLGARLDLMNKMQEQLYLGQMPPKKKAQPAEDEKQGLLKWLSQELLTHQASKLEEKLRYPSYGNYVDHDRLFSGKLKEAAFTPARRWLVSPQIFEQRVMDVFGLEGRERDRALVGVTNPFLLPEGSGVRDYDTGMLNGGSLLVMLSNAEWISYKQIHAARVKIGEIGANDFPDPKDRWVPKQTPAALESVIVKKGLPSDQELEAAIRTQFESVLRRVPTEEEMDRYVKLTRSSIEIGGNTEGLRQMLVAVLLESEFLYRIEFGAGNPDSFGRKLLAPREAANAISYAMGDRGPDAKLLDAAARGQLSTREDFKREVLRLLEETNYYFGQIDPDISGMHVTSHKVSHPKIVRFFREFFGYAAASKVFKDSERSDGVYRNPDRGSLGTPGFLINEADKLVDWCLQQDKNVFENLLTTDKFFVYHNVDNKTGAEIVEKWRGVYEALKNTDWKQDPEKVVLEHAEMLNGTLGIKPGGEKSKGAHANTLTRCMTHFEFTFGRGNTPLPVFPWQHGYTLWHSPIYNLPSPPGKGGRYGEDQLLNYSPVQPFKLEHRKGILTHPAWLIAHSQNTQSDPVKRGRWVREKLLAGRVPDIPITVDAVIPEDHEKTLRSRLEKVTAAQECAKCHQFMNPLGVPFGMYDDFGRFRTVESLEHADKVIRKEAEKTVYQTLPIDAKGMLEGTGDPALDGSVNDALEMIDRLAKSTRVRQSIIRYAFRFYLGRNEMLSDATTLLDADRAYVQSGGSFKAVIVSLLTSDSFMYRK